MLTRLIFSKSNKNLELARQQLAMKYNSIDDLFLEVQKNKCNAPEKVDDYMLWQAINTYDKQLEESAKTEPSSTIHFIFKEELIFHTAEFYQILTPRRMELLEFIHNHNPESIKSLANTLNRDYKNVYDDVLALPRYHLLELVRKGKNKRPVSRLTAIEVLLDK